MKTTRYFELVRNRPDRKVILDKWIEEVIANPVSEIVQQDGRIRRWGIVAEMANRVLRVVLLPDGETVHNAFFDRTFRRTDK